MTLGERQNYIRSTDETRNYGLSASPIQDSLAVLELAISPLDAVYSAHLALIITAPSVLLLRDMEDKPVKPIIKRDLASEPTFFRGPFGKLKQIGLHAPIGKASDPVDP